MDNSMESNTTFKSTKNNKVTCCVYGCFEKAKTSQGVTFHYFPKIGRKVSIQSKLGLTENVCIREFWIKQLKLKREPSNHMRVCSNHFEKEHFSLPDYKAGKRRLKWNASPTMNLPNQETEQFMQKKINDQNRSLRKLKRQTVQEKINLFQKRKTKICKQKTSDDSQNQIDISAEEPSFAKDAYINEDENLAVHEGAKLYLNKEVQCSFADAPFFQRIVSDKEMSTLTGISTIALFEGIVDCIRFAAPHIEKNSKICLEDKVIMKYVKLKQNMSYSALNVLFKCCSVPNCRKIVLKYISILNTILDNAIVFPTVDEFSRNILLCFEQFQHVRASIDCTEIPTQKPKNFCCQIFLYSNYKGTYTCKLMTAVNPSGHLIFRSKVYEGRSSDKAIFLQCNFINLLEKGDGILTDKGFLIDEICEQNDVKLVRPAFLRQKKQFDKDEAIENALISFARVHVERYNQRIKSFKILDSKLPCGLISPLNEIVTIVCRTINISAPILKDNKYFKD